MVGGGWYKYVVVWGTCGLLDVLLGACGCVVGELVACWMHCWGFMDVLLGNLWLVVGELVACWMYGCWGKVDGQ